MSTISPKATVAIAHRLLTKGCCVLDVPISGGERAIEGSHLAIIVGGRRDVFQNCLLLFRAVGRTITYVGTWLASRK